MSTKQKYTGRTLSFPAGTAFGIGISLAICAASIALMAKLIAAETLAWEHIGYGIMIMLLAASFLGAVAAYGKIRRQRLMVCLVTGVVFFCILLSLTALFFGGQYDGVGVTFLLVLAGSGCAGLLGLREGKGSRKRRIRRR